VKTNTFLLSALCGMKPWKIADAGYRKERISTQKMRKSIAQIILLVALIFLCVAGGLIVKHILDLPFRSANDQLHAMKAPITLDFLIPGGTYVDEKMTIGEVIRVQTGNKVSTYEQMVDSLSRFIPLSYIVIADLVMFLFWSFMFMTVIRVFTFAGYGRALRTSLFLGGVVYYFMPDFTPGSLDDAAFVVFPLLIIVSRAVSRHRKRNSMWRTGGPLQF